MNIIKKFTLASMKNNRRWTIVTVIGIIISVAMLSAIATLTSSFLSYMIENEKINNGDWHVRLQHSDQNQLILKVDQPFVDSVSWQRVVGFVQIEDPTQSTKPYLQVTAMDSLGFTQQYIKVLEGRLPLAKGEIVMTEEQAKEYKIGDQLLLSLSLRTLNGEVVPAESGFMRSYETADDGTFIETAEQLEQAVGYQFKLVGIIEDSSKSYSSVINAYTFYDSSLAAHYDPMVSIKLTPLRQSTLVAMTEAFKNSENMSMTVNNQLLRYYGMIGNLECISGSFLSLHACHPSRDIIRDYWNFIDSDLCRTFVSILCHHLSNFEISGVVAAVTRSNRSFHHNNCIICMDSGFASFTYQYHGLSHAAKRCKNQCKIHQNTPMDSLDIRTRG